MIYETIDSGFNQLRDRYHAALELALKHPRTVVAGFLRGLCRIRCFSFPLSVKIFFPVVDGGQMRLHIIAPKGSRLEETERVFKEVEAGIRQSFRQMKSKSSRKISDCLPAGSICRMVTISHSATLTVKC